MERLRSFFNFPFYKTFLLYMTAIFLFLICDDTPS